MRNVYFIIFILALLTTITHLNDSPALDLNATSFELSNDGTKGAITKNDTKVTLSERFGISSLKDESIWIDEGTIEVKITRLFAETNPVTIYWGENKKVKKVVIDEPSSRWNIAGIYYGTPIKQLQNMNGNAFKFNAFGWDQGGLVIDWNNGELSTILNNTGIELGFDWENIEKLGINVDPFMGDGKFFNSDDSSIDKLELSVTRIVITFN